MRWFKPNLRSSLHAIFSSNFPDSVPTAVMEHSIEDIRQAMLDLMANVQDEHFPHVLRRIRYATDVQALWFLRGDLMGALASSCGEVAARQKLQAISEMFEDLLPTGLRSRPSPLGGQGPHPGDDPAPAGDSWFKRS